MLQASDERSPQWEGKLRLLGDGNPVATKTHLLISPTYTTPKPKMPPSGSNISSLPERRKVPDQRDITILHKRASNLREKAFYVDDLRLEISRFAHKVIYQQGQHFFDIPLADNIFELEDVVYEALANANRISSAVKQNTAVLLDETLKIQDCLDSLDVPRWIPLVAASDLVGVYEFLDRTSTSLNLLQKGLNNAENVLMEVWNTLEETYEWLSHCRQKLEMGVEYEEWYRTL
ncbi:hypothetical protein B0T21DRAFT_409465 [Apiosordaria backusii]|uniref:Uncharacterized protein n=1 Tax=Apiosordaria backusii TaxID=314023 RepID=A0AA40EIN6_9PEZI|nr:hypothetical protein B0T21DRAFT_409465 [Apiosordaria backusii]